MKLKKLIRITRIIPRIWLGSFYRVAVNHLTTRGSVPRVPLLFKAGSGPSGTCVCDFVMDVTPKG
jgi:hypothetical protein